MSLINNFNNRKVFFGFSIGLLETLIIIISNIIFIPAYIKHWNVEEYYSWLLFLTATFFLNIIYLGFNDFIFHENLKNKNNKKYILENSSYLLLIIFTINCLLLFVGFVELNFNLFAKLLNISVGSSIATHLIIFPISFFLIFLTFDFVDCSFKFVISIYINYIKTFLRVSYPLFFNTSFNVYTYYKRMFISEVFT